MALIENARTESALKKIAAHTIGKVFHACVASMRSPTAHANTAESLSTTIT